MREYKFRGKRVDNGEWVVGDLIHSQIAHEAWINTHMAIVSRHEFIQPTPVDPSTVGQYTGLPDKNGVEVYEGDLLRFPAKNDWEKENYVAYEVYFHDNDCADRHIGWQMNRVHFHGAICGASVLATFLPKWVSQMERIGNVWDNPDLLKGGAERG